MTIRTSNLRSLITNEHDVLTECGWISIDIMSESIRVACMDNGIISYKNPTGCFSRYYIGKLISLDNYHASLNMSYTHEHLSGDDGTNTIVNISSVDKKANRKVTVDECYIKAMLQGTSLKNKYIISDDIADIIDEKMKYINNVFGSTFKNPFIDKSAHTVIPGDVLDFSPRLKSSFLKGLVNKGFYLTKNINTRDIVMKLAVEAGFATMFNSAFNHWVVIIYNINSIHIDKNNIYSSEYNGEMYGLCVNSDYYCVRRHGRVSWLKSS